MNGTAHVYGDNIDTDRIIPGKYTKTLDISSLAAHVLEDLDPSFRLKVQSGDMIVAGDNFGCGSSREHAAWALADYGFKAVLSSQFADIFKGNALKNGILPIELPEEDIAAILNRAESQPGTEVTIDLEKQEVRVEALGYTAGFEIHPFHKHCLLNGLDETGFLIGLREEVRQFELQTQTIAI